MEDQRNRLPHLLRLSSLIEKVLLFIIAGTFFSSCAMLDSATSKTGSTGTETAPETFYVGQEGLKLFPEPRFSKELIATLPLNEKVLRDKLEKGFAHVRVVRTGQTGWVNNAQLNWKLPSSTKPVPAPAAIEEKAPPKAEVIEAPSDPSPDGEGRDATIFNRF